MIKVGDEVVCLNDEGIRGFVTLGRTYSVLDIRTNKGVVYIRICDDKYNDHILKLTRFFSRKSFLNQ